ncbi:hypothetical protein ADEAN_000601300 [Angomonas deanei]|uniref:Uncharacterized protein n=1 Tax=Angomonas deanei TaxID=59799 RepID=A0A7G2CHX5_9TRYP|nr:hypothetical protein ADEAN_000601300 [Angomonas deanei]
MSISVLSSTHPYEDDDGKRSVVHFCRNPIPSKNNKPVTVNVNSNCVRSTEAQTEKKETITPSTTLTRHPSNEKNSNDNNNNNTNSNHNRMTVEVQLVSLLNTPMDASFQFASSATTCASTEDDEADPHTVYYHLPEHQKDQSESIPPRRVDEGRLERRLSCRHLLHIHHSKLLYSLENNTKESEGSVGSSLRRHSEGGSKPSHTSQTNNNNIKNHKTKNNMNHTQLLSLAGCSNGSDAPPFMNWMP